MTGKKRAALVAGLIAAFLLGFGLGDRGSTADAGTGNVLERIHPREEGLSWAKHFSRIVVSTGGRTVQISPTAGTDGDGNIIGKGDIEAQARQIYKKLGIALKAAGATPSDVVMHRTYVVGLKPEDGPKLSKLMAEFYPEGARPAAHLLGIETLIDPDLRIEMGVTAVIAE